MSTAEAEYLAKLFQLHLWVKPADMRQRSELADHWFLPSGADPQATVYLRQVAAILKSPRQVKQLVNLYQFAQLLKDQQSPVTPAPGFPNGAGATANQKPRTSFALQTHLAVLVLNPTQGEQFLDIIARADPCSTIDHLLQNLDSGNLNTPEITELFQTYDRVTDSPTPVEDLQDWLPIVQRLVI
jgi:hypothetical protein